MDSKIRAAIGWTDIKKREEAVKALIEAEIVEARIDEAEKIYTNYIPAKTLIGRAVRKRINKHKDRLKALNREKEAGRE